MGGDMAKWSGVQVTCFRSSDILYFLCTCISQALWASFWWINVLYKNTRFIFFFQWKGGHCSEYTDWSERLLDVWESWVPCSGPHRARQCNTIFMTINMKNHAFHPSSFIIQLVFRFLLNCDRNDWHSLQNACKNSNWNPVKMDERVIPLHQVHRCGLLTERKVTMFHVCVLAGVKVFWFILCRKPLYRTL
jgi:hypothetical protein